MKLADPFSATSTEGLETQTCKTCRFFKSDGDESGNGECRSHPPVVFGAPNGDPESAWPASHESEWCGAWTCQSPEIIH